MKPEYQSRYADLLTGPSDEVMNMLIQELDTAYTAPTRPAELSWATAQRRLALVSQPDPNAESLRPPVRPLRGPRGGKVALIVIAAIVALTVLSAALLNTVGILRSQQSQQPPTSANLLFADAQLLQQLVQDRRTPTNIQQLVQHGQFTSLNLASHTYDVHIQKVYADANNVVILYTVDMSAWNAARTCSWHEVTTRTCVSEPVLTLTSSNGQVLPENVERANMGNPPVMKNKLVALLAFYDASVIQGNPAQLTLTATLAEKISPSQEKIGQFTVPVHTDKTVLQVHQTASSRGHDLTLERVVITPTEARFYYSHSGSLADSTDSLTMFGPGTLSINGKSYDAEPFPASNNGDQYGWFGTLNEQYESFYEALPGQTGNWVVTENAVVNENRDSTYGFWTTNIHYSWKFTFTVS